MPDRDLIETGADKRSVRRDELGRFKESDDVGRSLLRGSPNERRDRVEAVRGRHG
jgi:hypothetical protein